MAHLLNRRRFMHGTSSTIAVGALSSFGGGALAQTPGSLTVVVGGGEYGKALTEAFVKPFEAETGIKVTTVTQDVSGAQLEMMVRSKSVTADVIIRSVASAHILARKGFLEQIDYSIYKRDELDGIEEYCKQPFGLASYIYSINMVYNTKKFPVGKPRPATWAEFWDVQKFPANRALGTGQYGYAGPFEEALLADGVAINALYPMDIDRIFASLDKIKPHVRKWWSNGSEVQQIMRDGVADLIGSFDGRALSLMDKGEPIEISRNQAKLTYDFWIIPKGSPNVQRAQKFIELTSRADRQAAYAQLFNQGPSNRNAFKLMADNVARKLPTYPEYMATSYPVNPNWYLEAGSDGKANYERLAQRWSEWILK